MEKKDNTSGLFTEREIRVYDRLDALRHGDKQEKRLAFFVMGILGNESVQMSLEQRLTLAENRFAAFDQARAEGKDLFEQIF